MSVQFSETRAHLPLGKDKPWIAVCQVKTCIYTTARSSEESAWAALEEHQHGDRCPIPLAYHGTGHAREMWWKTHPDRHILDQASADSIHAGDCRGTLCPRCGCCEHCIRHACSCDDSECDCPREVPAS